jgi:hypothetical protein
VLWHPRLAAAHSDAWQLTPSLARNQRFARFSGESGNIAFLGRLSLDVVMTLPNVRCQPASHHPKRRPRPNDAPKRRIIWLALEHSGPTRPAAPVRGAGWLGLGFPFDAPQSTAVNRSKPSIFGLVRTAIRRESAVGMGMVVNCLSRCPPSESLFRFCLSRFCSPFASPCDVRKQSALLSGTCPSRPRQTLLDSLQID